MKFRPYALVLFLGLLFISWTVVAQGSKADLFTTPENENSAPQGVSRFQAPTEASLTETPLPTIEPSPTKQPKAGAPTRVPRPTATPLTIPPPSDPGRSHIMVGFGVLAAIVVVVGVWINRHRVS